MKRAVFAAAVIALFAIAQPAGAADTDLLREKVRLAMVTTFNSVAAEAPLTTNHAERITIVRGWFSAPDEWAPRGVRFVISQQPTYTDVCKGDAEDIRIVQCVPGAGTQSDVDFLMSSFLTNSVAAGYGG